MPAVLYELIPIEFHNGKQPYHFDILYLRAFLAPTRKSDFLRASLVSLAPYGNTVFIGWSNFWRNAKKLILIILQIEV